MPSDRERLDLLEEAFNDILDNIKIEDKKLKKKLWIIKRKLDGTYEEPNPFDFYRSGTTSHNPHYERCFLLNGKLHRVR